MLAASSIIEEEITRHAHLTPSERISKALSNCNLQQCSDVLVWEAAVCLQAEGISHEYVRAFCCGGSRFCLFSDGKEECCADDVEDGLVTRRHCRFVINGVVRSVYVYSASVSFRMNRRYVLRGLIEDDTMHLLRHDINEEEWNGCPVRDILSPLLTSALAAELLALAISGSTTQRQSGILDSLLIGSTSLNIIVSSVEEASALADSLTSLLAHHGRLVRLSLDSLNDGSACWLPLLDTETCMLYPSLLQLPHDAVLVVDESGMQPGVINSLGLGRISALQTLATHQRLDIAQNNVDSSHSPSSVDQAALEATLPSISLSVSNPVVVISCGAKSMLACALAVKTGINRGSGDKHCFWKPSSCTPVISASLADAIHADYLLHRSSSQQKLDENGLALALNLMRMHVSLRCIENGISRDKEKEEGLDCSWDDWCQGKRLALDYLYPQ